MCDSVHSKPQEFLAFADRVADPRVSIAVSRGRIVIEPSGRVSYDFDALVDGITGENRHVEADFGAPVGKEIW